MNDNQFAQIMAMLEEIKRALPSKRGTTPAAAAPKAPEVEQLKAHIGKFHGRMNMRDICSQAGITYSVPVARSIGFYLASQPGVKKRHTNKERYYIFAEPVTTQNLVTELVTS
jgi:hypothetical protein